MTAVDHEMLIVPLDRLKLTAIRDQLDSLLDEAARSEMTSREALAFLVTREIARPDERRISASELQVCLHRNDPRLAEREGWDSFLLVRNGG